MKAGKLRFSQKGAGLRPFLGALTAVLLYLAGGAMASRPAADQGEEKRLAALFAGLVGDDAPGLAVLLKADGRLLFRAGYGLADLHSKEQIDADGADQRDYDYDRPEATSHASRAAGSVG